MTDCYVARSDQVAARDIGGELMILSFRDSSLFSLNPTAALLWHAADGATPLARIVERDICAAFEVDAATALRDAEELVRSLAEHGILRVSPQPMPAGGEP
jgi:Coenzyme PQQ synthesis protein D (PqqD)